MDARRFMLSYYKNATEDFYIDRITRPQGALERHSHGYYQIYYILRGAVVHHLGQSSARLSAGDGFILPPDLPHHIEPVEGSVEFYALSFTPDYFDGTKESNKLLLDFLYYLKTEATASVHPRLTLNYEDGAFVEMLLGRIREEFLGQKTGKNELIRECLSVILTAFARVYFEERAHSLQAEKSRQLVHHCIAYIKNHFDEDITLTDMVRLSAMSKTSFCALFTELTGTSFKDYLNRYRIQRAAKLLQEGTAVAAVSIRCGYNDLSTFHRNFKKYMGMAPSAYGK